MRCRVLTDRAWRIVGVGLVVAVVATAGAAVQQDPEGVTAKEELNKERIP
jgi:hypothetical protein